MAVGVNKKVLNVELLYRITNKLIIQEEKWRKQLT